MNSKGMPRSFSWVGTEAKLGIGTTKGVFSVLFLAISHSSIYHEHNPLESVASRTPCLSVPGYSTVVTQVATSRNDVERNC